MSSAPSNSATEVTLTKSRSSPKASSSSGVSRTVGSATLTAAQLAQLKLASSKGGAVPKSVLEDVIKGSIALLSKVGLFTITFILISHVPVFY